MGLKYAHGSFVWGTADAGGTTYNGTTNDVVDGLPFTAKAVRVYWMGLGSAVDANSETVHSRRGVGFGASTTNRRCMGSQDQDAAATSVCTSIYRTDAIAATVTSTPAVDGLLDINSITSGTLQFINDDAPPVDIAIFWEAWGSDDNAMFTEIVEVLEPAATGNVTYEVGFTPAVIMTAGIAGTGAAPSAARNDSNLSVGFATGSAPAENVVVVGSSDDASAAMDTDGYCQTGQCLAAITTAGGNPNATAQLVGWTDRGFTLNWISRAVNNRRYIVMAISGGQWQAGAYTIDGNTLNATTVVSGLAFKPIGVSLIGRMTAQDTIATSTANDRIGLGSGSSTSSRRTQGGLSENATASSVCEIDLTIQYDQVLAFPDTAGALLAAYDINSMNGDGFTIIVDVAGGVASEWHGFLAFGGKAPVALNNYMHARAGGDMSVTEKIR